MATPIIENNAELKEQHVEDIAFVLSHVARNKTRIKHLEEHDEKSIDYLSRLIRLFADMNNEVEKMRKIIITLAIGLITEFAAILFLLWMVLTL